MSTTQLEIKNPSLVLFATGIPCLLVSLIVFGQRHTVAALVFGARFFFGVPYSSDDSLKLLFVGFGSLVGILMGLALIVAGIIVFTRSSSAQPGPEGTRTIPTSR